MVKCKYRETRKECVSLQNDMTTYKMLSVCCCKAKKYSVSILQTDKLIIDSPMVCFDCDNRDE